MVNGCEVRVPFSGDTAQALEHASDALAKLGYEPKSREPDELKMSFSGKWFTSDTDKMRHSVTVSPGGAELCFKFGTGLIASHWTDADRQWAQSRADQIVNDIQARASGEG